MVCYYLFANSIDVFLNILDTNKISKKPKHWGLFAYCIMMSWFATNYALNPDVIGTKTINLFTKIIFMKPNEKITIEYIFPGRDAFLNGDTVAFLGKV
mmetsp:Transcript_7784/g.8900  ORF Transcript_7784/g.8900 Transcript_7784/m.8900 type:complete len:98 (-) Transcript_7784:66-359(-)